MNRHLLAILLLVSHIALADAFQEYDPSKFKDRKDYLLEFETRFGAPIDKFFALRDENKDLDTCRASLKTATAEYLEALAKNDDVQKELKTKTLLPLMQKCGRCTADVKKLDDGTYEADGWCRIRSNDKAKLAEAQNKAEDLLKNVGAYNRWGGGFPDLVRFKGIDVDADGNYVGEVPYEKSKPLGNPFLAIIDVAGPLNQTFEYYSQSYFKSREDAAAKEIILQFKKYDVKKAPPPGLTVNEIKFQAWPLSNIYGMWYADSDGNFRYMNRGDFGKFAAQFPPIFIINMASRIMIRTIYSLYHRIAPAEAK